MRAVWHGATLGLAAGALVVSCAFRHGTAEQPGLVDAPASDGGSSDAQVDASSALPPPSGAVCSVVAAQCADATTLRTCATIGQHSTDTMCAWGCQPTAAPAHCGVLQPAGSGIGSSDVTSTGLSGTISLSGTIDADTGAISGTTTRAAGSGISANIDYEMRGNVAMFRFASLHVTGTIALDGTHPVVFVADQGIVLDAVVDATAGCSGTAGGPGGTSGGARNGGNGGGTGGGGGVSSDGGGGGGGYGGTGGSGGGTTQGTAGAIWGDAAITTLAGGAGGGGGFNGITGGSGGGGGGAVQFVSNATITINAGGGINAGGCGGGGGTSGNGDAGGGGGGAGGVILLEAPTISINGGSLAVNGGGGGGGRHAGGGNGQTGSNGQLARTSAQGGGGDATGGNGAAAASSGGVVGGNDGGNGEGGGGGGGAGWMRFNTRTGSGTTISDPSKLSPNLADATTCTQGTANIK